MRTHRRLSPDDIGKLIALAAGIFGVWLRLLPATLASFPINDGGLFYLMVRAVQEHGLRVPEYVQYNGLSIPFAYPPLAFLLTALIAAATHVPVLDLLRWLPAIFTALTVPAVFLLARDVLEGDLEAGLATMFFAFTPRGLTWMLMGGGLTRSLGELFLVLTVWSVYRLFTRSSRLGIIRSALLASIVVLAHPEATLHTLLACLLLWALYGRDRAGAIQALSVAATVMLITAPAWMTVLARYGTAPIFSAAQTGDQSLIRLFSMSTFSVTEEPFVSTIYVLGLIGLFVELRRRRYFLPAFAFLPFLLEPRNAANVAIVPISLLAAIALVRVLAPVLLGREPGTHRPAPNRLTVGHLAAVFLGFTLLINAGYVSLQVATNHLQDTTLDAFRWVKENTPPESVFLVMTGELDSFCDPVQEWFPVMTERRSETTPQGREWLLSGGFGQYRKHLITLQGCVERDIGCLNESAAQMGLTYDYLYIQRLSTGKLFCVPRRPSYRGGDLLLSIIGDGAADYAIAYETDDVVILARTGRP